MAPLTSPNLEKKLFFLKFNLSNIVSGWHLLVNRRSIRWHAFMLN